LRDKIKQHNLVDQVFLVGPISEAGRLLTAFDIFVFPSRSEAFGYVLLEAGAAGIPVVSTNVGGIRDVIIPNETGLLVQPDSTNELQAAIVDLLNTPEKRARLAAAHQRRAATFTIEAMLEKTLQLYKL